LLRSVEAERGSVGRVGLARLGSFQSVLEASDERGEVGVKLLGALQRLDQLGIVELTLSEPTRAMAVDLAADELAEPQVEGRCGGCAELGPDCIADLDARHVVAFGSDRRCRRPAPWPRSLASPGHQRSVYL